MRSLFGLLMVLLGVAAVTANTCAVDDAAKTDCGHPGITTDQCLAKGCCWQRSTKDGLPWCYYSGAAAKGYEVVAIEATPTGFSGKLKLLGSGTTTYGPDLSDLKLDIVFHTEDIVQFKLSDVNEQRWEIPSSLIRRPQPAHIQHLNYNVNYTKSPFSFKVTRKEDGKEVFNFKSELVYKDQFIEFSSGMDPRAKTFGIGESTRLNQALRVDHTYTLWAADIAAATFDTNLYGSYPYYVNLVDGKAHGALLMNSNGMDVTIRKDDIRFQVVGGVIDMYIFTGSSPEQVVQQYTHVVGKPAMMPYWTLGLHNCRWGYENLQQVKEIVANYSAAGIPLETQWVDIDHMQDYRDFTLDSKDFPEADVKAFVDQLHANGQKFVPIVDPGIMPYSGYDAYEEGVEKDVFIKDIKGKYYLGQVWPGATNFPDFLHPNAQEYWTNQIKRFHDKVEIDGVWIDMNEISNFCNHDGNAQTCENTDPTNCPEGCCLVCTQVDANNKYDYPPYSINNFYGKVGVKTIAMSSVQYGDISYYNTHNLFGLTEQIATNAAITEARGKRPFVLSRSSYLSTGVHSAKWTGDNAATWNDLKSSIVSIMDFNLFGVPMIGADICGFIGDTTEELCARWIEVGAFYPFTRDHNTVDAAPQELYLWSSVTEAAKKSLAMKYQLLPYYYSLFFQAHTQGSTVIRGLWNNFPSDPLVAELDSQFMVGKAILVTPVLLKGQTEVTGYFPAGLWYKFSDRKLDIDSTAGGKSLTIPTPLTDINVHVLGGNIVPLQDSAMTTTAARQTPFTILAALCQHGKAKGSLFWDDGEQVELKNYLTVDFEVTVTDNSGLMTGKVTKNSYPDSHNHNIGRIVIMAKSFITPKTVLFNNQVVAFSVVDNVLTVSDIKASIAHSFTLQWY